MMDELASLMVSLVNELGYHGEYISEWRRNILGVYPLYRQSAQILVRQVADEMPFTMIDIQTPIVIVNAIIYDDGGSRYDERIKVNIYDPQSLDKIKKCVRERERCVFGTSRNGGVGIHA